MTAKEMFESLGYKKDTCCGTDIYQYRIKSNSGHIVIQVADELVCKWYHNGMTGEDVVVGIDLYELQAINQQCLELGWVKQSLENGWIKENE